MRHEAKFVSNPTWLSDKRSKFTFYVKKVSELLNSNEKNLLEPFSSHGVEFHEDDLFLFSDIASVANNKSWNNAFPIICVSALTIESSIGVLRKPIASLKPLNPAPSDDSEKISESAEVPEAPEPSSDVLATLEKIGETDEELLQALAEVPDSEVDIMGSAMSLSLGKRPSEGVGLGSASKKLKLKSDCSSDEENFDLFEEVPTQGASVHTTPRKLMVRASSSSQSKMLIDTLDVVCVPTYSLLSFLFVKF